ncbi:MAG TPA: hypothetical protein VN240_02165, partial [Propylenella sp.]|nr:hypothetical protein [Propylenella sp.]
MVDLTNLSEHQSNVSATTSEYLNKSVQRVGQIRARILSSKYKDLYQGLLNQANSGVLKTVAAHAKSGWNTNDHRVYFDALGLPFRKDGTVGIVISSKLYLPFATAQHAKADPAIKSTIVNGKVVYYLNVKNAQFDGVFNRIIITPFFASAMQAGRVEYFGAKGWTKLTMEDVLHHEFGHGGDVNTSGVLRDESALYNSKFDLVAEQMERLGQLVEGRNVHYPHGQVPNRGQEPLRFLDENGVPYPDTLDGMRRFSAWQKSVPGFDDSPVREEKRSFGDIVASNIDQLVEATILLPANTIANVDGARLGMALGSVLGSRITDNPFGQVIASGALSTALGAIGEFIDVEIFKGTPSTAILEKGLESFGENLVKNIKSAGVGAVSSFLTAKLMEALNLNGVVGEVANSVGGAVINQILSNLSKSSTFLTPLSGVNPTLIVSAVGSYLGTKLAAEIKTFESVGGQIGTAVGAAYGAIDAAPLFAAAVTTGNPYLFIAAVVVVAIDTLLGGLIGSVFGGTPRSGADATWDPAKAEFVVANVYARKGGSKQAAKSLAGAAAENFNAVLNATGSTLLDPTAVQAGNYGMRKSDFVYRPTSTRDKDAITARFSGKNGAQKLIDHGTYLGLSSMVGQLAGGDVYVKRALAAALAGAAGRPESDAAGAAGNFAMGTLLGDVMVAGDYGRYLEDSVTINALMAAHPQTSFSAGWLVTFARAAELGLNRRSYTDWIGGYDVFLDEAVDGKIGGEKLTPAQLEMFFEPGQGIRFWGVYNESGALLGFVDDTIEAGSGTKIGGTPNGDTIRLSGDRLLATTATMNANLTVGGAQHGGQALEIGVAATIDAGEGADYVYASDRGDNLLGGGGNDHLYGGRLDDWLFGGDGSDILHAGSDTGGLGGDGNYLDGGAGNDTIVGREGSDWLEGGDGTDALDGGGGDDIVAGGGGARDELKGG